MARDYKDTAKPKTRAGRAGPFLLGLMIGLLTGVLGSAGVALYVSKMPNPFQKPARSNDGGSAEGAGAEGAKAAGKPGAKDSAAAGDKPRFTFYDDLPKGNQSAPPPASPASGPAVAAPAPPAAGTPSPPDAPAAGAARTPGATQPPSATAQAPKPTVDPANLIYFIQAGAYQNQEDADNQKRAIALIGLDAKIRTADTPDKGRVFRVRLGPYSNLTDANQAAETLKENGIAASMVKVAKAAPKPAPAAANN